jgi:hypothetical protein
MVLCEEYKLRRSSLYLFSCLLLFPSSTGNISLRIKNFLNIICNMTNKCTIVLYYDQQMHNNVVLWPTNIQ